MYTTIKQKYTHLKLNEAWGQSSPQIQTEEADKTGATWPASGLSDSLEPIEATNRLNDVTFHSW